MKIHKLYDAPAGIGNQSLSALVYKVNKMLVNLLYHRTVKLKYGVDESSNVIVSLTSFPGRIDTVWITVATLLTQTVKPKAVILWLAEDQFPGREADLPEKLLKMQEYGLTIRFCDNLYPHKKYYYTMQENPDASVITADDDIYYPEYLIEELLRTSEANPGCVCCTWAHEITLDENGQVKPYSEWKRGISGGQTPSLRIMPVGCGGVLYPPHLLHSELYSREAILETCLKTDDLWLKCMALKNRVAAVRVNRPAKIYFSIMSTQNAGLHYENVGLDKNDLSIRKILDKYPECRAILTEQKGRDR